MSELRFRPATDDESDPGADLVFGTDDQVAAQVAVAVFGARDHEQLRPLMREVWRNGDSWRSTWLAVDERGDVLGLLKVGTSGLRLDGRLVRVALRTMGWRAVRLPWRLRVAARVVPAKPAGSLVVAELHVRPDARGGGVGARLLEHAETLAIEAGCDTMSLDTYANNPACRLYERTGFRAAATTHDATFERLTGVAGRILYVKSVAAR